MRFMEARYPGTCRGCGARFPRGTLIGWAGRGWTYCGPGCAEEAAAAPIPRKHGGGYHPAVEEGAPGHGPGCYGECDGLYDCHAPAPEAPGIWAEYRARKRAEALA